MECMRLKKGVGGHPPMHGDNSAPTACPPPTAHQPFCNRQALRPPDPALWQFRFLPPQVHPCLPPQPSQLNTGALVCACLRQPLSWIGWYLTMRGARRAVCPQTECKAYAELICSDEVGAEGSQCCASQGKRRKQIALFFGPNSGLVCSACPLLLLHRWLTCCPSALKATP